MAIVVVGAVFVDVKGFPEDQYIPTGRNAGKVEIVHGGVGRNVAEDIANIELRPTFVSLVDDTAEGEEVINKLRNHKVNTDYIRRVKDGMGMWLAVFDNMGDIAGSISKRPDLGPICDMLDEKGVYPAQKVTVRDTTGAGDAFCAGVAIGLTYKKSMREAVEIGTRLAASVITASENVCPRFRPRELGLDVEVES